MSQNQSQLDSGWIKWFCNLEDHHFFCEIDEFFITEPLNLYGLKQEFDHFEEALQMILSSQTPNEEDLQDEQFIDIFNQATELYGLLHERFIITPQGLTLMKSKYLQGRFGVCPRVLCDRQNVLPIGLSHELRTSRVKVYCPRCQDVYTPKRRMNDVDGCFFGVSFPHIFLSVFTDLQPQTPYQEYIPKLYGFKMHQKKGSVFNQQSRPQEIYYFNEEHVKRLAQNQQNNNQDEIIQKDDIKIKSQRTNSILKELREEDPQTNVQFNQNKITKD